MPALKKKQASNGDASSIVVRSEYLALDDLRSYHKNPRRGDIEVVAESLKKNGQFRSIVVNIGTLTGRENEVLAGNHTVYAGRRLGWERVLCDLVDVDEAHARRIVLADNATADQGSYDSDTLTELLSDTKADLGSLTGTGYTQNVLDKMLSKQEEQHRFDDEPQAQIKTIEEADENIGGVSDLTNDIQFDSDSEYDIPELLSYMCLREIPQPIDTWGGHELDLDRRDDYYWMMQWAAGSAGVPWDQAISYLFCPDEHFERMYQDPATCTKKLLNVDIYAAVVPNYSTTGEWPLARNIWAKYRSNFVARYWQEAGIKVIPDIQYCSGDDNRDLVIAGIPEEVPVACQVQNTNGDMTKIRAAPGSPGGLRESLGSPRFLSTGIEMPTSSWRSRISTAKLSGLPIGPRDAGSTWTAGARP